jgi:hypothetical protein
VNTDKTFSALEPFTSFSGYAFDESFYTDIPPDWLVVTADIENSTQAVSAGQYEAVNYVGAACITALNNAMPALDFPKVFGGDGASAVVPPEYRERVTSALLQVTHWAQQQFGLNLVSGIVPMQTVMVHGGQLSAGKLRSATGVDIAMFRGNGLDIAESIVRETPDNPYRLQTTSAPEPDLTHLSCRWSPISPVRDHMLCIIVGSHPQSTENSDDQLSKVVHLINTIVTLDSDETIPTAAPKLQFKLRLASIRKEIASAGGSRWQKLRSVVGIHLLARVLFAFKLRAGGFDAEQYRAEIADNSDYIKVAGSVKMVLDCTSAQSDQIESMLEAQFQAKQLVYGLYRAKQALMTCITPDINSGNHMHYVDGSDGGLWQAASGLKQRIANAD